MYRWIAALCVLAGTAHAGQLQTKPVICGSEQEAFATVQIQNQQLIYKATQITTVKSPTGFAADPILLPVSIFMNLDKKTYTIMEYHPRFAMYCIISFGNQGEFTSGD